MRALASWAQCVARLNHPETPTTDGHTHSVSARHPTAAGEVNRVQVPRNIGLLGTAAVLLVACMLRGSRSLCCWLPGLQSRHGSLQPDRRRRSWLVRPYFVDGARRRSGCRAARERRRTRVVGAQARDPPSDGEHHQDHGRACGARPGKPRRQGDGLEDRLERALRAWPARRRDAHGAAATRTGACCPHRTTRRRHSPNTWAARCPRSSER